MNNDKLNELLQGLGAMSEFWIITYESFKKHGLSDSEALTHTQAFMSIMLAMFGK